MQEEVTSPTFLLLRRYEGTRPFYHVDAYRMRPEEAEPLMEEIEEDVRRGAIVAVEWPERGNWSWRLPTLAVEIAGAGDEPRRVVLRPRTPDAAFALALAKEALRASEGGGEGEGGRPADGGEG
ncbi:threonylcarbamoyl adenosine biosynthesis protein TsaE [Brockia lithotrophica]|uniref:tRNA threonylcarbamoyladenosine biosynthesis protein TsaE n=1 Tax=Brockia lithotrophica TaxID=933949 RepID=A0A660KWE7_9BACL|nr:threonylcarbamoyl adenosine biosynthesis protein TsaE [Brockia lithotrophica]